MRLQDLFQKHLSLQAVIQHLYRYGRVATPQPDRRTTHEEADTILIHQVAVTNLQKSVVISDDTDVFVLLLHFSFTGDIKGQVYMQPTSNESSINVIDINATYEKHKTIARNVLAAHALSGCDTVGTTFGIGKVTVVKSLNSKDLSLLSIGDLSRTFEDCVSEGTHFFMLLWPK